MFTKIRYWLIWKLAGKDTIILNAEIGKDGAYLTWDENTKGMCRNSSFTRCPCVCHPEWIGIRFKTTRDEKQCSSS